MRRQDGQARALFRLLTMPILAALKNADVIPIEGQEGGTQEAQFCKDLLFASAPMGGMTHSITKFIKQMLLALFNGFSAWELVYWVPKTGPNKGKITLRKIDWRPSETLTFLLDGQGEFSGFRQRCVSGDVEILQLDGTSVRIDEMARRHDDGQEQWVYSCTKDGRVVPGKVKHAWKNRDSAPIVEVELDSGEKVRCTPDHPWMLRDGTYRWAERLKPGDSLMPLYRKYAPVGASKLDYEYVLHPASETWETTHRMVSEGLGFGTRDYTEVIHHGFDGLKHQNNDPRNLHRMTRDAHCELHAKLGQLHRSSVSFSDIERVARELRDATGDFPTRDAVAEVLGCSGRLVRDRLKEAGITTWWEVCRGIEGHELTFEHVDEVARSMVAAGDKLTLHGLAAKMSWSAGSVFREIQNAGYAGWMDYRRALNGQPVITMSVIGATVRTLVDAGVRPDRATVEKALTCSFRPLRSRLKAAGYDSWEEYISTEFGVMRNHKVRSVKVMPNESVYDLEVEKYHNFALSAGVFISNTFFQGRTIDVKIAKETSLYFANDEAERPFYGVSMFESAFYHYDKKIKLEYIAHLAAQRAACGTRVGTMKPNPNAADKNNFTKALANLGLAQYIVVPDADWTVTNLEEKSNFDFLGLINFHNSQMSKSVLAAWFDEAQGAGQGDSTLVDFGKQEDATFLMMLDGILTEMSETINHHLLPRFVDWNFGSGKYPHFKWGELTAEQKAAIQDSFDKLAVAGQTANVTPEFMLELEERMATDLGLDIDYDKIKADREKQQKLMAKQANAQATMMANGQPVMAGNSAGGQGGKPGAAKAGSSAGGAGGPAKPQSSAGTSPGRTGPGGPYGGV